MAPRAKAKRGTRTKVREAVTIEAQAAPAANLPAVVPEKTAGLPMEMHPDQFSRGLLLRQENREELLSWVRANLKEDRDFGTIKDAEGNPKSKVPSLWQPGAQQICGLLGLRPTFPDSEKYVDKAVRGDKIEQVVVRCVLVDAQGNVVSEGMGARSAVKVFGDWKTVNGKRQRVGDRIEYDVNYALKMAQKSAHIDATLRAGGLSAIFTQDMPGEDGDDAKDAEKDESTIGDHPAELVYLRAKAAELFGDKAETVLTALAARRMRIQDGDYRKIKFRLLDYCITSLERRAADVEAGNSTEKHQ